MPSPTQSREKDELGQEELIGRLRRFVEASDFSFYQIASRVGISGTMLSMWLAGTARPDAAKSIEIDRFLKDSLEY
jgi:transcriptional regulator with XRE-family HTH domain